MNSKIPIAIAIVASMLASGCQRTGDPDAIASELLDQPIVAQQIIDDMNPPDERLEAVEEAQKEALEKARALLSRRLKEELTAAELTELEEFARSSASDKLRGIFESEEYVNEYREIFNSVYDLVRKPHQQ